MTPASAAWSASRLTGYSGFMLTTTAPIFQSAKWSTAKAEWLAMQ